MNRTWLPHASLVAVLLALGGNSLAKEKPAREGDPHAKELALRVHRQAAAIDELPRLYYQGRLRVFHIDTMRNVEARSIDLLKKALGEPVRKEDLNSTRIQVFGWDETHFVYGYRLLVGGLSAGTSENHYFGTKTQAWHRYQSGDDPATFGLANTRSIWEELQLTGLQYVEVTPHEFWWGSTKHFGQTTSTVPPKMATYRHVGTERFGGETCEVVEAVGRTERLWISRETGRLRGVLPYIYQGRFDEPFYKTAVVTEIAGRAFSSEDEFKTWRKKAVGKLEEAEKSELLIAWCEYYFASNAVPHKLIRFSDYREISPDIWIPFREEKSSWSYSTDTKAKQDFDYVRSELIVEEVKTDFDLTKTIAELMPKDGERIGDRRFTIPVSYEYRADRTREEILDLVAAQMKERERFQEQFIKPIEAMVGKPAPELPAEGWLGGARPKLEGTPYLVHFWATWCGPCKNDLPLLKDMAAEGTTIIGVHPPGTPSKEVEKLIAEEELGYSTLLVSEESDDLGGYPVKMYPYCIVVDGKGNVSAHGSLRPELLAKFRTLRKDESSD